MGMALAESGSEYKSACSIELGIRERVTKLWDRQKHKTWRVFIPNTKFMHLSTELSAKSQPWFVYCKPTNRLIPIQVDLYSSSQMSSSDMHQLKCALTCAIQVGKCNANMHLSVHSL